MKIAAPYRIRKRKDAKTYAFKLGETAGLSAEICAAYKWKSFAVLPAELAHLRRPRTKAEAESSVMVFIEYLKKNLVPVENTRVKDFPLVEYALDFWTPGSNYVRDKKNVDKKPMSFDYVRNNHNAVKNYAVPRFKGITLLTLRKKHIKDFISELAQRVSGRKINIILQAIRVPVRYFLDREEVQYDPFRGIKNAAHTERKRGVLTLAELNKIIDSEPLNLYRWLAVLLAAHCGLRLGEVRGLQWEDIKEGKILINHNYQNNEGLKGCKCGSEGIVPVTGALAAVLERLERKTGYVFENSGKPVAGKTVTDWYKKELENIGINTVEQKARNLTFHGLRHTFVTLGRQAGITDMEIQALARHRDSGMMNRYSHADQVIDIAEAGRKLDNL